MAPAGYEQRPEVPPHLHEVWGAFAALHESRRVGMDASGIAPTDLAAWLDLSQVEDPDLRHYFAAVIHRLDSHWLTQHRKDTANRGNS